MVNAVPGAASRNGIAGEPLPEPMSMSVAARGGRCFAQHGVEAPQLVERVLGLLHLAFEHADLFDASGAAELERVGGRAFARLHHLRDLAEGEAELLRLEDQRQPFHVPAVVKPHLSLAARRDEAAAFIEAQRPLRHAELLGYLADGERPVAAGRRGLGRVTLDPDDVGVEEEGRLFVG